jgi:hypothetical protein
MEGHDGKAADGGDGQVKPIIMTNNMYVVFAGVARGAI